MGSSGSGKTTLLDVLAMRTTRGDAVGQLLHPCPPEDFGYVLQDDVLLGTLTVEEMLTFGVMLRRKQSADAAKRDVESVMRMLRLTKIRSQRIGTLRTRGISGGERRRVSIGLELALKPKVLFIDEATHPDSTPSTCSCFDEHVSLSEVAVVVCRGQQGSTRPPLFSSSSA
jgi:ABC-type multidrug transport system ATPase subunit